MIELPIALTRRVGWGDVDVSGAWRFTAALSYVEEAEIHLMREIGVLGEATGSFPRVHVEAQFSAPAHFDDEVVVHLDIAKLGTSSIHYSFHITRQDQVAVEGKLVVAFVGESGRAEPLRPRVRDAFASVLRPDATQDDSKTGHGATG